MLWTDNSAGKTWGGGGREVEGVHGGIKGRHL